MVSVLEESVQVIIRQESWNDRAHVSSIRIYAWEKVVGDMKDTRKKSAPWWEQICSEKGGIFDVADTMKFIDGKPVELSSLLETIPVGSTPYCAWYGAENGPFNAAEAWIFVPWQVR